MSSPPSLGQVFIIKHNKTDNVRSASAATIVRLGYFTAYSSPVNYMQGLASIAVWSMVECGTGIVAGSIATFKPLFRFVPFLSQSSYATRSGAIDGHSRSHHLDDLSRNIAFTNKSQHGVEDGERSDAESQKHILKETRIQFSTTEHDANTLHVV